MGNEGEQFLIAITDFDKTHINKSRQNLFFMLHPMNRQKAKEDFVRLAKGCQSIDPTFDLELKIDEFKS